MHRIRQTFDTSHDVSSGLSVYLALTEVASNTGKESFITTQGDLGQRSGLSVRKVADVLKKLRAIELIEVTDNYLPGTSNGRAPSTFTLLFTSRTRCATSSNRCGSSRTVPIQRSLPSYIKKEKETKETDKERDALKARFGAIFNRRGGTAWSDGELKAFSALLPINEDDLALVEQWYTSERKRPGNICRRSLHTLLINFPGDVDRARGWKEEKASGSAGLYVVNAGRNGATQRRKAAF